MALPRVVHVRNISRFLQEDEIPDENCEDHNNSAFGGIVFSHFPHQERGVATIKQMARALWPRGGKGRTFLGVILLLLGAGGRSVAAGQESLDIEQVRMFNHTALFLHRRVGPNDFALP